MNDEAKKKILVVDDEEDVRTYLVTLLEDNGYETAQATDGDVAFRMVHENPPDLITLDLQMPNETGTRFFRTLMKDKEHRGIPVIVISGLAGRHLAMSEPVAVFDKPVEKDQLLEKIRETIGE
jgi:CheY-like chemotaxis protein